MAGPRAADVDEAYWGGGPRYAPMISYAQNYEDVRLRRLFPADYVGFYIDVGANHPTFESVTRYFYDRGWRGINVEPVPELFEEHRRQRPRDLCLDIGLSNQSGSATFYQAGGLSTFSAEQARAHRAQGVEFAERVVPIRTLASVCEEHDVGEVDFLSIDAEGFERQILEGADFARWRPLVIVIEAIRPITGEPSHRDWEDVLHKARYACAAFDGLNRYYVREEDAERGALLEVGPNVFDNFVPYRLLRQIKLERKRARQRSWQRRLRTGLSRLWSQAVRAARG